MQSNISQGQPPITPLKGVLGIQNSSSSQIRYITLSDLTSLRPSIIANNIGQSSNVTGNLNQVNIADINNVTGNIGQIILNNSTGSIVNSSNFILQKPLIVGSLQNTLVNNFAQQNLTITNVTNSNLLDRKTDQLSIVNLNDRQNILQLVGNNIGSVSLQPSSRQIVPQVVVSCNPNNVANKVNAATYVRVSGSNQIFQLSTLQTSSKTNQAVLIPTSMTVVPQQNANNIITVQNKVMISQSLQANNVSSTLFNVINQNNHSQLATAIKNLALPQGAVIVGNSIQMPANNSTLNASNQVITLNNLSTTQKGKILLLNNMSNHDVSGNVKILPANSQGVQILSVSSLSSVANGSATITDAGMIPKLLAPRIITQNTGIRDVHGLLQKLKDHQYQQKFSAQPAKNIGIASAASRPVQIAPQGSTSISQPSRIIILNNGSSSTSNTLIIRSTPTYNLAPTSAILKSQRIMEEAVAKAKAEGLELNESDIKKKFKRKGDLNSIDGEDMIKKRKIEVRGKGKGGRRMEHAEDGSIIFDESIDMSEGEYKNKSKYGRIGKKKKVPTATLR